MGKPDDANYGDTCIFTNYFPFRGRYSGFSKSPIGLASTHFSTNTFEGNGFSIATKESDTFRRVKKLPFDDDEFDQFLDFLTHLSTELASGTSPEYALARSSYYFGNQTPNDISEALSSIIDGKKPFHLAWSDLVVNSTSNRTARLLELLGRFIEKGSVTGGERMLEVLRHIRKNSAMTKNRKNLIKSQKMKVFALSFVSSVVISLIAAIAPLLTLTFYQGLWASTEVFASSHSFYILIASFLTVIVTGYHLNKTVSGTLRTISINLIAFGITYIFMSNLLLMLL